MRQQLLEIPLEGWIDPADVYRAVFAGEQRAVWFDSGAHAVDGMSYIGVGGSLVVSSVADMTVTVDGEARPDTIFEFLREQLEASTVQQGTGFRLGWVGWLGYELRAQSMGMGIRTGSRYPDAALLFVDRAIVFDHSRRSMSLIALGADPLAELQSAFESASWLPQRVLVPPARTTVDWATSDESYLDAIHQCQAAITAGDAYQLCLTTEARVAGVKDPLQTYLALRSASPSHHGALFIVDELALLSSSPEQFLTVSPQGEIQSKPIKGTRRRGANPAEDEAMILELVSSDKERAENLMIVDLMRNDIGRVSRIGSVAVTSLLAVETYAQVHQLVSTISGQLADGRTGIDAVEACFPAGSMTGAPKFSAVTILDRLENRARGLYAGAFGYFSLDGRIDLAMVIRSIVLDPDGATVGAGGGITALSVPSEELEEMHLKAAALLAVLGVR
jgi:para-aminobenzoate synthetase component 1